MSKEFIKISWLLGFDDAVAVAVAVAVSGSGSQLRLAGPQGYPGIFRITLTGEAQLLLCGSTPGTSYVQTLRRGGTLQCSRDLQLLIILDYNLQSTSNLLTINIPYIYNLLTIPMCMHAMYITTTSITSITGISLLLDLHDLQSRISPLALRIPAISHAYSLYPLNCYDVGLDSDMSDIEANPGPKFAPSDFLGFSAYNALATKIALLNDPKIFSSKNSPIIWSAVCWIDLILHIVIALNVFQ